MAAQQPNFIVLSQHLIGASAKLALIPNVPFIAIQPQLNQILNQLGSIQQQLNNIQAGQDLLPMRLRNTAGSVNAPLQYPANVVVPPQAPGTKQELMALTAGNCQIVAQALNLPALPHNANIAQRRQQIMDHLGCGITA
ncbi:hypothetical protein PILCRDRAFT_8309 [Piloderma croceum F 1598]|uniref:Uncharacterized protein n=1 Tax=Piloderma croceum (strain F 1598) TaxID=765440 RepID=A0A0C3FS98_PILCF|nr:hypothetical protein PILCRDRAFT_8309 [Piloderma croceum F 1598]